MKPLTRLEIRDLNAEIEDRINHLKPLETFGIVHAFKAKTLEEALKRKTLYGLGFSTKDIMTYLCTRFWDRILKHKPEASAPDFIFKDITGTDRTLRIYYGSASGLFNDNTPITNLGTQLGFGNPASPPTPARQDYELVSPVARFDPSSKVYDEALLKTTLTGSYVWASGGTIREIGQYINWYHTGGASVVFLMYHDAVSDVVCPAGGTVAVTYLTNY